jgi:hypothetical protein
MPPFVTRPQRDDQSRWRRAVLPLLSAAFAAAIAIGVLAVRNLADGQDRNVTSEAEALAAPPTTNNPRLSPPPSPTLVDDPTRAYARCASEVRSEAQLRGDPSPSDLTGRAAAISARGITVVVSNATLEWTCNLKPDLAVSAPAKISIGRPVPQDFALAHNVTQNVLPGDPGEMVWGGGALPQGVTSVTFAFPDGHQEPAITQDGYWVMQYFSEAMFAAKGQSIEEISPIIVRLTGPAGSQTLTLNWRSDNCDQVSHGC